MDEEDEDTTTAIGGQAQETEYLKSDKILKIFKILKILIINNCNNDTDGEAKVYSQKDGCGSGS